MVTYIGTWHGERGSSAGEISFHADSGGCASSGQYHFSQAHAPHFFFLVCVASGIIIESGRGLALDWDWDRDDWDWVGGITAF